MRFASNVCVSVSIYEVENINGAEAKAPYKRQPEQ